MKNQMPYQIPYSIKTESSVEVFNHKFWNLVFVIMLQYDGVAVLGPFYAS